MTTDQSRTTEATDDVTSPESTADPAETPTPPADAGATTGPPTADGSPEAGKDPESTAGEAVEPAAGGKDDGDETIAGDKAADRDEAVNGDKAGTDKAADGDDSAADKVTTDDKAGADDGTDRWTAFAPAQEKPPTRLRRVLRGTGRVLVHEWTLAGLAGLLLAVAMTWPTLRYPRYTIPQDYWDPSLQAWQMAWSGHSLLTDPTQLWHSNTFYPLSWSFAFSDTLLGYAPAGMIGEGPVAALVRYNIMYVLAHALATVGAYALVRQLGAGRMGAAVAGVGYAYAPWLLSQAGHLHVISNGGIPLALAMLARGHGWSLRHGYRPERRHAGWALAGWLVAAWQVSLGFGIGLAFAYVVAVIVLVALVTWFVRRTWFWSEKRPFGLRLLLADLGGGVVFAATGALLSLPYFKVADLHPYAKRSVAELQTFSPPARGFLIAPAESRIWGDLHEQARASLPWNPEMTLLPGYVLYALAAVGLVFSIWTVRQRLLLLAGVLVTGILAMGTTFFGGTWTYLPLFEHLPGWDGLRTPGRLMLWTTLLLGVLAAGSVSALAVRVYDIAHRRIPPWPGPWLRLVMLLPLALVAVEGLNVTPHPVVPTQPAAMRTVDGPVLVLPSDQGTDQLVMLWSTTKFQDVVNGGSGFIPLQLTRSREATQTFPDGNSISYLRDIGVRTVVVLRDRVAGTPWESAVDRPVDTPGVQREEIGNTIVFRF